MGSMLLRADTHQSQTLSPRLQRAVQMLQMSSLEFSALLRHKMDENPFLEEADDAEEQEPSVVLNDAEADDRMMWSTASALGGPVSAGLDLSAMDLAASPVSLAMHLHGQLNVMALSPRDLCAARAIVESLDDDGYLRTPLEDLLPLLPASPALEFEELMVALRLVQSLEPAGTAARDVSECLALQCSTISDTELRALALAIVQDHLPALASHDIAKLARQLKKGRSDVERAIDAIKRLNPHPGWAYGAQPVDYIVPDVLVQRAGTRWHVQLNPAAMPRVRMNRVYESLFKRHRQREHGDLGEHLQDARWTLRNVEQRCATILEVAQALVRRQHRFLEFGAMAMKPLMLREIAQELGIHESTVSRVTNNKYIATPQGVFELKHFFSRPLLSASGKPCSATAIREVIAELIAAENPLQPLSDVDITRQLAAQGLVVARRTVTKYRQLLRLEPVEKRRRHS
ncbi:MAG: RNA polymerase factor sigma-54 [Comamonas sp.]|nr:RNA polymerase factor sigma-54 [Comamonas sp.]